MAESVKASFNAFANTLPVSSLVNPTPTLKLTSRSKLAINGASNVASFLFIQPNIYDSYAALSGNTANWVAGSPNQFTLSSARFAPDAVFYNSSGSSNLVGNTTGAVQALYAPGYSSQADAIDLELVGRVVSVGIRLQNRTVLQYRMPVAYIYHDYNGELNKRLAADEMTHADLESYITSSPHCITWDCTVDPIFEMTITCPELDGRFETYDPNGIIYDGRAYRGQNYLNGNKDGYQFTTIVGNWGVPTSGRYSISNAPVLHSPSVFVIFPGPVSTSFLNQYELTIVNNYEVKNHVLEASGLTSESISNVGVKELVRSIHQHKHRNMGKALIHGLKKSASSAFKATTQHCTDAAAKMVVSAAIAAI